MNAAKWPHPMILRDAWERAAARLQSGGLALLGPWGEPTPAHMAGLAIATHEC